MYIAFSQRVTKQLTTNIWYDGLNESQINTYRYYITINNPKNIKSIYISMNSWIAWLASQPVYIF